MGQTPFGLVCTGLVVLAFPGCGVLSTPIGSVQDTFRGIFESKETQAARQAKAYDAKYKSLGFDAGTEGYRLCRHRLKTYGPHEPLL
jgi:hypothetical protein